MRPLFPTRPQNSPRRTLAQEFRDSFLAGPRAWYVAGAIMLALPWLPFLGIVALVCLPLLLVPAAFGAALGRVVAGWRDARTLRRLERLAR